MRSCIYIYFVLVQVVNQAFESWNDSDYSRRLHQMQLLLDVPDDCIPTKQVRSNSKRSRDCVPYCVAWEAYVDLRDQKALSSVFLYLYASMHFYEFTSISNVFLHIIWYLYVSKYLVVFVSYTHITSISKLRNTR